MLSSLSVAFRSEVTAKPATIPCKYAAGFAIVEKQSNNIGFGNLDAKTLKTHVMTLT
ncbi:hypothetical protein QFZ34_003576 [Phyllobacterium ifriqiyense]|uniref:Uncharacterized protein n=1 Tax=Phyllobacterium ifriqiyense TaxID=314238 RepID=A0ABU0SCB0_9HYPH|nr:hypothetical protein [Phyllobacterium ifriqiyense]